MARQVEPGDGDARPVFVIFRDVSAAAALVAQLDDAGYTARRFDDLGAACLAVRDQAPAAVLVGAGLLLDEPSGGGTLDLLRAQCPEEPALFVLGGAEGYTPRLAALKYGARAYLRLPPPLDVLLDRLDEATDNGRAEPLPCVAMMGAAREAMPLTACLTALGVRVVALAPGDLSPEKLVALRVDLLVDAGPLPMAEGLLLGEMLRQDTRLATLPVGLLRPGGEGADAGPLLHGSDFILPCEADPGYLARLILERARDGRRLAPRRDHDSLTDLPGYSALIARLEPAMRHARRRGAPFTQAVIDLDGLAAINLDHGLEAGDRVLRALARFLVRRLGARAIVGRHAQIAFALGFPDQSQEQVAALLAPLRESFSRLSWPGREGRTLRASFRCGIAALPADHNVFAGFDRARAALRAAKGARDGMRVTAA